MKKEIIKSKKLASYIFNFVKLNPKDNKYPNFDKYDINSFYVIQKIYRLNIGQTPSSNYDNIFFSENNKFLSGQEWLDILNESQNFLDYHSKIRNRFFNCDQKKLKQQISYQVFSWYYHSKGKEIIDEIETSFKNDVKTSLSKIRNFLLNQEWAEYFFNLQKLMHSQLVIFLSWKSESLNFASYSKLLKKKLREKLSEEQVLSMLEIVQEINLYRNSLSKASSGSGDESLNIFNSWNNASNNAKTAICLNLYFKLLEFISVITVVFNNGTFA